MLEYVYPAIFHKNDDNSYTVIFPDLQGCITEGKSLGEAMKMAQSAVSQWLEYSKEKKLEIPQPSLMDDIETEAGEFVNLVRADVKDGRAVRRTVSIPKWMDERVSETGLSLSRVLQDALQQRL
jgi:predicted RNase H-like HicB family nuclease